MSRTYHQDYIARIRYSNNLPPPPGPPKLLDIPGTGLGDGRYTSAAYASRLIREQPLNIEIDAELGMPLDLVGLPGVFDGDESAIQSLDQQPPVHPQDAPLLRPANMLAKTTTSSGATFLRRGIGQSDSDNTAKRKEAVLRHANANGARKRARLEDKQLDDRARIVSDIESGFEIANGTTDKVDAGKKQLWDKPVHPENSGLTLLDAYPILPDLDAVPDLGSYTVTKFQSNPLGGAAQSYDTRLDVAVIRPKDPPQDKVDEYNGRLADHEQDPVNCPHPGHPMFDYDLYLPNDQEEAAAIKAQITEDATHGGAQNGETEREARTFSHMRLFETYQQAGDLADPFGDTVAIALHDGNSGSRKDLAQGAYVYPIAQRTFIRAHRGTQTSKFAEPVGEGEKIDQIDLTLRAANDEDRALREKAQEMYGVGAPAAAAAVTSAEA